MGKEIGRNASKSCCACAKQVFPFSIFFCGCKQPKSIHMFIEIVCKGTNKCAKYIAKRFFCFYFRTKVPSTDRSMLRISERKSKRNLIFPNASTLERSSMLRISERNTNQKGLFVFISERKYLRPTGQCYE